VIGTPHYMSPEQCEGKRSVDHRTDIYALGIVLYEMLTGRVPFRGNGFAEVLVHQLASPPVPPSAIAPGIPVHVERAVLTALEKRPEDRYQRIADMALALRDPGAHAAARPTMIVALDRGIPPSILPSTQSAGAADHAMPATLNAGPEHALPTTLSAPAVEHAIPTTLSGSAAQSTMSLPARRGMRVPVAVGLAVGLALAGAVVGIAARRFDRGADRPAAAAAPVESAVTADAAVPATIDGGAPDGASLLPDAPASRHDPATGTVRR
jgi:serine/threonine-protein kinase